MDKQEKIVMNEENYFHQHKDEIGQICKERGVDLGVGVAVYRNDHREELQDIDSKISVDAKEWLGILAKWKGEDVKEYFYGEG